MSRPTPRQSLSSRATRSATESVRPRAEFSGTAIRSMPPARSATPGSCRPRPRISARSKRTCTASWPVIWTCPTTTCSGSASRRSATMIRASPARRTFSSSTWSVTDEPTRCGAVVIGVGNEFRGDDAAGLLVARRLRELVLTQAVVLECEADPAGLIEAWVSTAMAIVVDTVVSGATGHRTTIRCIQRSAPGQAGWVLDPRARGRGGNRAGASAAPPPASHRRLRDRGKLVLDRRPAGGDGRARRRRDADAGRGRAGRASLTDPPGSRCARLFLRGLEVGVGAGGVVRDVDDLADLGHRPGDGHLDPLAERDRRHATALASAAQAQVGRGAFDGGKLGAAAVAGDARVDLAVEHSDDATGDVGVQPGRGH